LFSGLDEIEGGTRSPFIGELQVFDGQVRSLRHFEMPSGNGSTLSGSIGSLSGALGLLAHRSYLENCHVR